MLVTALVSLLAVVTAYGQTAKVQVIHNAADPSAETVDIYVDPLKALDGFTFRTASPFVDLPAGIPITIAVAPASSMSATDALATFTLTL